MSSLIQLLAWNNSSLTHSMSLLVQKRVKAIAEGVAAAFDMDVEVELKQEVTYLSKQP